MVSDLADIMHICRYQLSFLIIIYILVLIIVQQIHIYNALLKFGMNDSIECIGTEENERIWIQARPVSENLC